MPGWCIKSTASPLPAYQWLPTITCLALRSIWWMWVCSAAWHSWRLPPLVKATRLFTEFKGALTENFVLQTLITQFEVAPRYWNRNNPPYEVDFLILRENDIFPVEVKSEVNTTSKSLKKFKELFRIRSSSVCGSRWTI